MGRATINQPVNDYQLAQAIGSPFTARADDDAGTVEIEAPDLADDDLSQRLASIVYDAAAAPPTVVNERQIREQVTDHLTDLRTIARSSGSLSNAQLSNAVRVLARGQIRLIRLAVDLYDGTD